MLKRRNLEIEIKVGIFVSLGIGLVMMAIILLGGVESLFSRQNKYNIYYTNAEGLMTGSKIILNGIRIGAVQNVEFDQSKRRIRVDLLIDEEHAEWIRMDTFAEIQTQGVLGDKYIALTTETFDEPELPPGSEIRTRTTGNLAQFFSSGEKLMARLNSITESLDIIFKNFEKDGRSDKLFGGLSLTARNLADITQNLKSETQDVKLKSAIAHLDGILAKIDNGTGTIGALVNDPSLYDDIKLLLGGANRNRVMRNIIRKTIRDGHAKTP